ncbi:MAG: hypothetical protein D3922_08645 [Candidatus Electrothrix sp. AR1]|nr:hypothetical protein [Candidatus Electrothrix sp. AR1]
MLPCLSYCRVTIYTEHGLTKESNKKSYHINILRIIHIPNLSKFPCGTRKNISLAQGIIFGKKIKKGQCHAGERRKFFKKKVARQDDAGAKLVFALGAGQHGRSQGSPLHCCICPDTGKYSR